MIIPKKKLTYILGIQSYASHDSAACILKFDKKGKILDYIAISEERLLRKKHPYTFPILSIVYCLKHFKLRSLKDIDYIFSDWIKINRWIRSGPNYNYQKFDYIKEKLNFEKKKIIQIYHHLAHAASTYYPSLYKEAAVLIVDGMGSDVETNSYYIGKGKKLNLIERYQYSGIGSVYGRVTNDILNLGTGGEGKTMGLAPYGKPNKNIKIKYKFKGIATNFSEYMNRMPHSDVLNQINDNFRHNPIIGKYKTAKKNDQLKKYFADYAYAIQNVCEKTMVHLGKDIQKKTKSKNICLAGGVALNSVANHKLFQKTKFKNIFIFPASSDCGLPFGLTLWGYYNFFKIKHKKISFNNAYTGTDYSENETFKLLNKFKVKYFKTNPKKIAELISNGNVIGNFYGKSEYGPRALGNRSILADPRNTKMRDYLNKEVKHREMFRPFAPAILENKSNQFFDINYSPYMLQVAKAKKYKKIKSVCHVDKTARVQTVNKNQNKNFYNIINEFYKKTKIPCVLNTSFNDAGEPIVETPIDALICFLGTKIDYLVLKNILIEKDQINNPKRLRKILVKYRDKQINIDQEKAIKILTKNFSEKEFKKKKKYENNKAINYTLNRPVSGLKAFFKTKLKDKKTLIIGTNDHTNILIKIFPHLKNQQIEYFEIKKNDIYQNKKKIASLKIIEKVNYDKYDNILISSYQHLYEINNQIDKKYRSKIYFPYDNSCRSIIDFYFIKKFKDKFPIYSKKLF